MKWFKQSSPSADQGLLELAALLKDFHRAVGCATCLWAWCAENNEGGLFEGAAGAGAIELAAGWRGRRGRLAAALIDCGLVERTDAGLRVVNGGRWGGAAAPTDPEGDRRRRQKRERDRRYRARLKADQCSDQIDDQNADHVSDQRVGQRDSSGLVQYFDQGLDRGPKQASFTLEAPSTGVENDAESTRRATQEATPCSASIDASRDAQNVASASRRAPARARMI